nr:MAG TPA: Lamprin [Caudoviricetes sp.]
MGKVMEDRIKQFLNIGDGDGSGDGDGYGYGSGYGSGDGDGYGSGYGYGSGSGYGSGYGFGYGYGSGYGSGYGYGSGSGDGVKSINGNPIYVVDNIPTIITNVKGNIAKGFILDSDLSLTPCFIVKENNQFSHGNTLHEAFESLQEKLYDDSTEEERILKFKEHFSDFSKKYSAKDLFIWHHVLTGSCKAGREAFCMDKGIDVDNDRFTVYEFIELTKNSYGGDIIRRLS